MINLEIYHHVHQGKRHFSWITCVGMHLIIWSNVGKVDKGLHSQGNAQPSSLPGNSWHLLPRHFESSKMLHRQRRSLTKKNVTQLFNITSTNQTCEVQTSKEFFSVITMVSVQNVHKVKRQCLAVFKNTVYPFSDTYFKDIQTLFFSNYQQWSKVTGEVHFNSPHQNRLIQHPHPQYWCCTDPSLKLLPTCTCGWSQTHTGTD